MREMCGQKRLEQELMLAAEQDVLEPSSRGIVGVELEGKMVCLWEEDIRSVSVHIPSGKG